MARRRPVHDRLVADALAQQRRAGAKLSRLRGRGINTETIDPRRPAADVRNMSNTDLRKYTEGLQVFVQNRRFVAGVNGAPINASSFQYLKRLERKNNALVQNVQEAIGDITVPTLGEQDIASQIERASRQKYVAGGEQRTFQQYDRQASDLTGQEAVESLIASVQKKLKPGYLNDRMQMLRDNLRQMLEMIGDMSLFDRVSNISDESLNIMADYSPFMRSLSIRYEYMKALNQDEQYQPEAWMQDTFDSSLDDIMEFLAWGENLDNGTARKPKRTQRTQRKPRKR